MYRVISYYNNKFVRNDDFDTFEEAMVNFKTYTFTGLTTGKPKQCLKRLLLLDEEGRKWEFCE